MNERDAPPKSEGTRGNLWVMCRVAQPEKAVTRRKARLRFRRCASGADAARRGGAAGNPGRENHPRPERCWPGIVLS